MATARCRALSPERALPGARAASQGTAQARNGPTRTPTSDSRNPRASAAVRGARQPEVGQPVLALPCRAGRPVFLALRRSELPKSSCGLSFSGMPNVPARLGGGPVLALESWPRPWAYSFPHSQQRRPRAPRRASGTLPMPADRAISRRHSLSARSDGSRPAFYRERLPARRTRSGAIRQPPTGVRPAKTNQRMIKIVIRMDAAPSLPRRGQGWSAQLGLSGMRQPLLP